MALRPAPPAPAPVLTVEVSLTPAMAGGPKAGQASIRVVRNGRPDAYSNKGFMPLAQAKKEASEWFASAKEEVAADKVRFATEVAALAAWVIEAREYHAAQRLLEEAAAKVEWAAAHERTEARRIALAWESRSDRWEDAQLNPYSYQGD